MKGDVSRKIAAFLFTPANDEWLAALRIGLGLQVALYCFALRHSWGYLFAPTGGGLLSRQLAEAVASAESPLIPRLGWIVGAARWLHIGEATALWGAWFLLLVAGLLLIAGLFCRVAAVAAWFLHLCAATSGGLLSYGVDNFMTIGLFYLMWAPGPDQYALDWRLRRSRAPNPERLGFLRRVLQLHLCVIYFLGGAMKSFGSGWWDGLNMWRALTREPFNQLPPDLVANFAGALPLLGIAIWVIELGYPIFIWPRRTRTVWLGLTCGMHLAIGAAMGMHLFAFVMIVLNVAAFGTPMIAQRSPEREPAS